MLLVNEQNQQINVAELKARLAINAENVATSSDDEMEEELGRYYQQAHNIDLAYYKIKAVPFASVSNQALTISFPFIGQGLLEKIKRFVCGILNDGSTLNDIIDAVLKAIASSIPGGMIIEPYVAKIIKYIVSKGINNFCGI